MVASDRGPPSALRQHTSAKMALQLSSGHCGSCALAHRRPALRLAVRSQASPAVPSFCGLKTSNRLHSLCTAGGPARRMPLDHRQGPFQFEEAPCWRQTRHSNLCLLRSRRPSFRHEPCLDVSEVLSDLKACISSGQWGEPVSAA